ncbi:Metallo-dependent phosphatase-like protein [Roridomyces roridus]|uniref:Metallo-dependent phosphatase-like protein n=1 Tax=Roridomyces roridus TaxID=1738132 RepID=A0AAD7FMD3_9AGAR|nr:Metallo-dependent phosphatase-like protein [Roridomyces roridus]
MESSIKLEILHFNDVYRVGPQSTPGVHETIDVTQFGAMLDGLRSQWKELPDGKRDGLVLFSGDVFSPSVESSVTRGSHMVPVMNELKPDISVTGNHDWDFGYSHLSKLIKATTFPWLLSNIVDSETGHVPENLSEFEVIERAGLRIGLVGLVEKEWIDTVASWPANFQHKDMKSAGLELSQRLRSELGCDLIIALTHCRIPNDIALAKSLLALSPSAQETQPIGSSHGVDCILGGHDHLYFASKGMTTWENYDITQEVLGAESDAGDVLVCKSGTDFRDLSELTLELVPGGDVRKRVIKRITGTRHSTQPGSKSSEKLKEVVKTVLSSVGSTLKAPVCNTAVAIDVRSEMIRTRESAAGNWFADVIRHAYDETLAMQGYGGADAVFICAGTLRGDSVYGPGPITLGNILEILPFEDPVIVIQITGAALWDALESSVSTWPAQEGRFPVISGFRVTWDSRRSPGQRILGVWLVDEMEGSAHDGHSTPQLVDGAPIERDSQKTYNIVTREYMASGHDGFTALKEGKQIIDDEQGQIFSAIVRKYLMGSHYVRTMANRSASDTAHLCSATKTSIAREQYRSKVASQWKHAAHLALRRSREHYREHLAVCSAESMSCIDPFDGEKTRGGESTSMRDVEVDDLLTINPEVDGRLRDEGRL